MLGELANESEVKLPDWDRSLVNIPATIIKIFGREPPHPPLPKGLLPDLGGVRKVILLVIDALGWEQLLPLLDDNLVFSRLAEEGRLLRLTSVFPSTTAAALSTLATGLPPVEHGMLGYRLYLKEFGLVANMIRLSPEGFKRFDVLLELGLKPKNFFAAKTIYELLAPDIQVYTLLKLAFRGSGLSHFLYRGSKVIPHVSSSDMCVGMRKLLEQNRDGLLFIGAYWDAVDAIAHLYGPTKEELAAELRQLSFSLEREFFNKLSPQASKDTLLLITADHGQVEVCQEEIFSITRHPRLVRSLLLPPTGDFRATYLHLRQGRLDRTKQYLKRYQDRLIVLDSEEALEAGLFGAAPIRDRWRLRIGDLILLARERGFIFYPYDNFPLKGYHGGLAPEEMWVPLFAVRLG